MLRFPSNSFEPQPPKDCVLDLSSLVDDIQDMDCELPEEDFLQQLSSDLEIPMLLEESLDREREMDSLFEASSFFKEFDDWGLDPFARTSDLQPHASLIKEEVKLEPDMIPSSPSSTSQDSWSSDTKNILETPPISPPQSSSGSPPRTPTPPSAPTPPREPPVIVVGGKPIKIVPFKLNGDAKSKMMFPRQGVLLPRPLNMTSLNLPNGAHKTLVLSPKEFSALTSQMSVSKPPTPAPTPAPVIAPTATVKTEPSLDIQMKAFKRQQRMIKNRESACLSRKKKKEYITSLENKISDLEKENIHLKVENEVLRARLGEYEIPPSKRPKTVFNVNIKKTAVLAVLLLVSVNLGSLSFMSRGRSSADAVLSVPKTSLSGASGRRLLWTDDSVELHNLSSSTHHPTCPMHINQTESLRLDSELRRWIGVEKHREAYSNDSEDLLSLPLSEDSQLILPPTVAPRPHPRPPRKLKQEAQARKEVQELQLVHHAGLMDALQRQPNMYYVVSFSGENTLLLPALNHNNSMRPKMSLVLPALPFNASVEAAGAASSLTMMQIDCEVLDTRLLELNERDIPSHLKPPPTTKPHKNVTDEEEPARNPYRPYFVRPNNLVDAYSRGQRFP